MTLNPTTISNLGLDWYRLFCGIHRRALVEPDLLDLSGYPKKSQRPPATRIGCLDRRSSLSTRHHYLPGNPSTSNP